VAALRAVLKTLPVRPGVYRMQDARGDVFHVGKARALKNRVSNHTDDANERAAYRADSRL
jgi:excinuclease ABC subunit C